MSSVTRLHLLSQSMLNVSCQKQKHCSSFPADSPAESPMEFIGQQRVAGPCNFLGVPGLSILDTDDDDCDVVINIRPKSSPLPRRRSSDSDDDFGPEPPLSGSRRVSFADAKGLSLVQVKEFDTSDVPKLPECDSLEGQSTGLEEYFLSPLTFFLPWTTEDLLDKVREQKVELETINILPGTTILKGVIRVLNISFDKMVYVRTTLDTWSSHFDLLAEYEPGGSDSLTDRFSFKLTLVPPFGEQGARVDFCLRYETPVGTFWANNNNRNYVLFCHQREKKRKESPQKEKVNKKSCLKTVSQNFSTVENVCAPEVSSPENISAEHGEEANAVKARQSSNGQSGTLEDNRQTSINENRQNCSRRRHRKATRMARVKDYFSQRNGGLNGTERDESPPEANQTAKEEAHSDVASFPEGSSKSEDSHFASESLGTCSEPLLDVLHDTSPAHDSMSNSKPEKSESISLAESATLTEGERAADIPENPSNDDSVPPGGKHINKSVSKAEENSQNQSMTPECIINIAAEPANSGISTVSSESLVNQTNSFTFGTVVAPLYHQVSGRVISENPVRATRHVGDLSQRYPRIPRRSVVPTDDQVNDGKVLGNVIPTPDPGKDLLSAPANSPPMKEEEASLTVNNITSHAVTLQNPDDVTHSEKTSTNSSEVPKAVVHPNTVKNLNDDLFNPQIAIERLQLHGEAKEDNLAHDLQLPAHTCTPTNTNLDETQSETQEIMTSLIISPQPSQSTSECVSDETVQQTNSCVRESNKDNDVGNTSILAEVSISTAIAVSEIDKPLETVHDLNLKCNNNSAARETEISSASCFEIVQEQDVITPHVSLENNTVEEGNEVVNNKNDQKNDHKHGDIVVELKDEEIKHLGVESAVAEQEGFCIETTDVNWEMMVEEEEKNILTEEDECEAVDLEAVEKDQERLEVAGRETTSENSDMTEVEKEDEVVCEFAAAEEKDNKSEGEDAFEGKEIIGEGGNGEIVVGKDSEAVEEELQYSQATKTAGVEEQAEEIELETSEEQEDSVLEKENLFEKRPILEKANLLDDEELEGEEGMETDLKDNSEAGVELEDQVKSMAVNVEEENPDVEDEIVEETGESEIPDAESESVIIDDREDQLDITQNTVEDGLSAPGKDVQDKGLIHSENGHITAEMHLYKDTAFQSSQCGLSDAKQEEEKPIAAEGGWCIFTDEPENDETSHDSASAESDSDDEMELYMHCLRAVHTGAQAQVDKSKDAGFGVGKLKHSTSRSKLLSSPMPSISESLDEEHLSCPPVDPEDMETTDVQPAHTAPLASSEQASNNTSRLWWKETFSCSKISNALLYATLLVVFLAVAYHYDFLACFGLYLVSVVWLYCRG